MSKTKKNRAESGLLIALGAIGILISACGSAQVSSQAPTLTSTISPTQTAVPTATATPTPNYGIDQQKFQNFPESYEYLLGHLDEFVKAPDPLTDRAAFDKWWDEQLVPILGPVADRPLTADTYMGDASYYGYVAGHGGGNSQPLVGQPYFFYFEDAGIIYPVPCMNVTNDAFPGETRMTACAALNDFVPLSRSNTNSLELFQSPTDFSAIRIYHNLTYMTDVDWGYLTELVPLLGEYFDVDNRVVFGFGFIVFDRNY